VCKAYLLRAVKAARKTLDITSYVQSGFLFKRKIDEKTGLEKTVSMCEFFGLLYKIIQEINP
jgi:hypothetical protein